MAQTWRNRMHHDDGTIEETKFKKDEKDKAKQDHKEKKLKLKKDEKATSHLCAHDLDAPDGGGADPPEGWWNCKTDPRAEYEEFTKKSDLDLGDILVTLPGPTPPGDPT